MELSHKKPALPYYKYLRIYSNFITQLRLHSVKRPTRLANVHYYNFGTLIGAMCSAPWQLSFWQLAFFASAPCCSLSNSLEWRICLSLAGNFFSQVLGASIKTASREYLQTCKIEQENRNLYEAAFLACSSPIVQRSSQRPARKASQTREGPWQDRLQSFRHVLPFWGSLEKRSTPLSRVEMSSGWCTNALKKLCKRNSQPIIF